MKKFDREPCTCLHDYKRRGRIDPQCKACNTDVNRAIDEVERLNRIADEQVQPQTNWFLYGERLPEEDDEDCEGNVWNFMPGRSSAPMLTTAGETRRRYETGIVVHWKPTGLQRPEPPEE